jgi:replicative DNA helicase
LQNVMDSSELCLQFTDLDRLTVAGQWYISRSSGMGVTAFPPYLWRATAVGSNIPCSVLSLEMSSVQLIARLISSETGLSSERGN